MFYACVTFQMVTATCLVAEIHEPTDCQQTCSEEKFTTFSGTCPTPETCSWHCAVNRFKERNGMCEGSRVYHCARNYTDKNLLEPALPRGLKYIEACAPNVVCRAGDVFLCF